MRIGGFAEECLLSRPPGTLSSTRSGGEGWGEEAHFGEATDSHWDLVLFARGQAAFSPEAGFGATFAAGAFTSFDSSASADLPRSATIFRADL